MASAAFTTSAATVQSLEAHTDITWDRLDKPRFFAWGAFLFLAVRSITYPVSLVKTRLQVGHERQSFQTIRTLSSIIKNEGPRALYQGFTITAIGALPGQIIYLSVMESTKLLTAKTCQKVLRWDENRTALVSGLVGGGVASLSTQVVMVPIDVVSQRLMVQKRRTSPKSVSPSTVSSTALPAAAYHTTASNGEAQHTTARSLITHILQTEGIRGLYRGFLTSIFTYAPSSAVWWGTQNLSKKVFGRLFHTEQTNHKNIDGILGQNTLKHFGISALSGFTAGCVAACVTNPLDVIKTRLQTLPPHPSNRTELDHLSTVFRDLIKEDGWRGFTRGMGARVLNMGITSVLMIVTYEGVKRLSFRERLVGRDS